MDERNDGGQPPEMNQPIQAKVHSGGSVGCEDRVRSFEQPKNTLFLGDRVGTDNGISAECLTVSVARR
jgi:hypothetical protein